MSLTSTWIASSFVALSLAPEAETQRSVGASGDSAAPTEAGTDTSAEAKSKRPKKNRRKDTKWIRRWAPERNMWELGLFGGVMFPHPRVELFESDFSLPDQGFRPLRSIAPEGGLRVAYFPLRVFGLEAE
ncbi:MAG: hypothetical protein K0V04_03835, partial [Deltaproteobacteria bacterium]|nr:hypothetical protein [Deltaproteobacteria bacterium]